MERLLAQAGPAALSRRAFRRRGLVLAYHNILPAGQAAPADHSLHLAEATFRAQLDLLEQHAHIVPLADLLAGKLIGEGPYVALTFDDAYRGAVTVGLRELAHRGHPATLFVTPGCPGGGAFWWDRISDGKTGGLPPPSAPARSPRAAVAASTCSASPRRPASRCSTSRPTRSPPASRS
ncbi:MAG: polysaccharide deacetylase family protein [Gemmatimonadetes bacterium]|nr:polysaccharide deacetylase family protein [Gemmatimonadota bacterium]